MLARRPEHARARAGQSARLRREGVAAEEVLVVRGTSGPSLLLVDAPELLLLQQILVELGRFRVVESRVGVHLVPGLAPAQGAQLGGFQVRLGVFGCEQSRACLRAGPEGHCVMRAHVKSGRQKLVVRAGASQHCLIAIKL